MHIKLKNMNTQKNLNIGAIICLIAGSYLCYYLLLVDKGLPFSISSVFSTVNHWSHPLRVLAIGLLPVYIAVMLFGMGLIGIYLGSALQHWITTMIPVRVKKSRKNSLSTVSKNPLRVRMSLFKKL